MTAIFSAILTVTPDPWWINPLQGLGLFFFFLVMLLSLIAIVIGLPGLWIIVAESIVFALVTHFGKGIGWWDLIALTAMAGAAELLEFLLTMRGAEKSGGSRATGWWAIAGGIVGAIALNMLVPIIGALIGAFAGAFAGAFLSAYSAEHDFDQALRVGAGAFRGRVGATLVKETIGVAMAAVLVWQIVKG